MHALPDEDLPKSLRKLISNEGDRYFFFVGVKDGKPIASRLFTDFREMEERIKIDQMEITNIEKFYFNYPITIITG